MGSLVSVIIPAYSAGQCVGRAIDSVLAQTYKDYEIIVVDDGSTDNTPEVVGQYGDRVRYIRQRNAGVAVARNAGIAAAKARWIAFLDADDEWLPDKLRAQMDLLDRHPDLSWCAANFALTDGSRTAPRMTVTSLRNALDRADYIENYFAKAAKGCCHIGTPTVLVRKELFEQLGGFEPGRMQGEDFDMWIRIVHHYPRVGFIAQPLAVVHLDIANPEFSKRRLRSKRGENERIIMARHLELAEELGSLSEFEPFACVLLRKALITTVYHGLKADAKETVIQFGEFFPWYWRVATYVLTVFPKLTSSIAKAVAYVRYRLGLERDVSRRWVSSDGVAGNGDE